MFYFWFCLCLDFIMMYSTLILFSNLFLHMFVQQFVKVLRSSLNFFLFSSNQTTTFISAEKEFVCIILFCSSYFMVEASNCISVILLFDFFHLFFQVFSSLISTDFLVLVVRLCYLPFVAKYVVFVFLHFFAAFVHSL